MRNQLNTQIDALKASNERLEQRIDMILTAKKGECEEPITKKADRTDQKKEKEKFGVFSKTQDKEQIKVTGKRISSSNTINVFLRKVTAAVKGNRKLLKKNILLTEKTENDWTIILKNCDMKPKVSKKADASKTADANRFALFLEGIKKNFNCDTKQLKVPASSSKTCKKILKDYLLLSSIKGCAKSKSMTERKSKMKKTYLPKAPSSHITRKKQTNWIDKLSREELLDLAINGKRLKDCKYKIVVAHGFPRGEHIIRETWAKLMGIEEKNIPLVKDIEGEGRIFLIRDEFCFQAAEALENASENVRVLVAENEVGNYFSRNRSALTKIFSDLRQNWRKYVPVDKAIKVIKNGLSDKPTVSHEEFFLSELYFEHLGKDRKVDSKHHNEQ
ncbi:ATP-dependent RNA helicase [Vairimorpha necatrix]|uniref:ATP-dependent RNA helicase n=1 Tax=Vairimorpha necatrix TaxID=6039 RepID=A0AAX4JFI1_9MICR